MNRKARIGTANTAGSTMRHRTLDFATELATFLVPLGVRLIPEMYAYPYPIKVLCQCVFPSARV